MICFYFFVMQNTQGHFFSDASYLYINHIAAASGGFHSALVIDNIGDVDGTFLLNLLDEEGLNISIKELNVPANSILKFDNALKGTGVRSAFVIPLETLHGQNWDIQRPKSNVFVTYAHQGRKGSETMVRAIATGGLGTKFRFFPGNWDVHFDGIALLAHSYNPATVTIKQVHIHSKEVLREEVVATDFLGQPFKSQKTVLLGGPTGTTFSPPQDTYFEVEATGLIGLTALRGNPPEQSDANLWEVPVSIVEVPEPEIYLFMGEVTDESLVKISIKGEHFVSWDVSFSTDLMESQGISAFIPQIIDGAVYVHLIGFETDAKFKLRLDGANGHSVYSEEITVILP